MEVLDVGAELLVLVVLPPVLEGGAFVGLDDRDGGVVLRPGGEVGDDAGECDGDVGVAVGVVEDVVLGDGVADDGGKDD
ncbi:MULTISPECIES: hypothetical protein [unclassified Nocardioides]|uniref:hypothetical protein n=1 Tax=unclassified Nocardioides TaxID=2615069 RepID=UPI003014BC58